MFVELTVCALHLNFVRSMCTVSACLEYLFPVCCSSNLSLENVEQFVAQILLIEEFDDKTGNLSLYIFVSMAHECPQELQANVKQAQFEASLDLVHVEVTEI